MRYELSCSPFKYMKVYKHFFELKDPAAGDRYLRTGKAFLSYLPLMNDTYFSYGICGFHQY